jgi:hypothetical protein
VQQALVRNAPELQRRRALARRSGDERVRVLGGGISPERVLVLGMGTTALSAAALAIAVLRRVDDLLTWSVLGSVLLP